MEKEMEMESEEKEKELKYLNRTTLNECEQLRTLFQQLELVAVVYLQCS